MKHQQIGLDLIDPVVTPHTGVWIETLMFDACNAMREVTPHTGVWIETLDRRDRLRGPRGSPPIRGCGLKHRSVVRVERRVRHPPYGGVD